METSRVPGRRGRVVVAAVALAALAGGCKLGDLFKKETPAASSSAPGGAAPLRAPYTFEPRAVAAGHRSVQRRQSDRKLTLELPITKVTKTPTFPSESHEDEERREEVLAARDGAITSLKVTYLKREHAQHELGPARPAPPSPVVGKTYTVSVIGGQLAVALPDNSVPPKAELDVVERDYRSLGRPDPLWQAAPREPIRSGERAPSYEKAVRSMLIEETDQEATVREIKVTLVGERLEGDQRCAVFEVIASFTRPDGPLVSDLDLKGSLVVRPDGWPVEIELAGPLKVTTNPKTARHEGMRGQGTQRLAIRAKYE